MAGLAALLTATLSGCTPPADRPGPPPPRVELDQVAPEVAESLRLLIEEAESLASDGDARGRLGMAYEVRGFHPEATEAYLQAAELAPDQPRWAYLAALEQARLGRPDAAEQTLDRAMEAAPDYVPGYLHRARWAMERGDTVRAAAAFEEVLARQAGHPVAVLGLARIDLGRGEPQAALERLSPLRGTLNHALYHQLLGRAYQELGREAEAVETLAQVQPGVATIGFPDPWHDETLAFKTGFGAELQQARKLAADGRLDEAIERMEALRARRPTDAATLNNLAAAYIEAGGLDRASRLLDEALRHHPDYFPFYLNRAVVERARGDAAAALATLDRAIALNPTLAHAHRQRGDLLVSMRKLSEAREAYNVALLYDVTDPELFFRAAVAAQAEQDFVAAEPLVQRAIGLNPGLGNAHLLLASLRIEQGSLAQATDDLDRAAAAGAPARAVESLRRRIATSSR